MRLYLRACAKLTKTLRYWGNTACPDKTARSGSCSRCTTFNKLSNDAADVVETYTQAWETFLHSSGRMHHCELQPLMWKLVQNWLKAGEQIILDLDARITSSLSGPRPESMPKGHYHQLVNFFTKREDVTRNLPTRAALSVPPYGGPKMELRMVQLEYLTTIAELLQQVQEHAASSLCGCTSVAQQHPNYGIDSGAGMMHDIMSARTRLLSCESNVDDNLEKLSSLTSDIPGIHDGYYPRLPTLASRWFQPLETCHAPRSRDGNGEVRTEHDIRHAPEAEELAYLLRTLDIETTSPDGMEKCFVQELQSLRAQHEALLCNANMLIQQMAKMQTGTGRSYGDTPVMPGATAFLGDIIYNYIFPGIRTQQPVMLTNTDVAALPGHPATDGPPLNSPYNPVSPPARPASRHPISPTRERSASAQTFQQQNLYLGSPRGSTARVMRRSASIAYPPSSPVQRSPADRHHSTSFLPSSNRYSHSKSLVPHHKIPAQQTHEAAIPTYFQNKQPTIPPTPGDQPSWDFPLSNSVLYPGLQQRDISANTRSRQNALNTAPPPYTESEASPRQEQTDMPDTGSTLSDSDDSDALDSKTAFSSYYAESLLWPGRTDSGEPCFDNAALLNDKRRGLRTEESTSRTRSASYQIEPRPHPNPYRRYRKEGNTHSLI